MAPRVRPPRAPLPPTSEATRKAGAAVREERVRQGLFIVTAAEESGYQISWWHRVEDGRGTTADYEAANDFLVTRRGA